MPEQPDSPYRKFLRSPAARHALRAARSAAASAGGRNLDGIAEAALEAGLRSLYVVGSLLTSDVREAAIAEGRRQATWDAGDHALRGFARALDESAHSGLDLAEMLDVLQLPADATPAQMLHGMSALVRSTLAEAFTDADHDDGTPDREQFVARVRRLMAESYAQEGRSLAADTPPGAS